MISILLQLLIPLVVMGVVVYLVDTASFISESVKPVIRWSAIAIGAVLALQVLLRLIPAANS